MHVHATAAPFVLYSRYLLYMFFGLYVQGCFNDFEEPVFVCHFTLCLIYWLIDDVLYTCVYLVVLKCSLFVSIGWWTLRRIGENLRVLLHQNTTSAKKRQQDIRKTTTLDFTLLISLTNFSAGYIVREATQGWYRNPTSSKISKAQKYYCWYVVIQQTKITSCSIAASVWVCFVLGSFCILHSMMNLPK